MVRKFAVQLLTISVILVIFEAKKIVPEVPSQPGEVPQQEGETAPEQPRIHNAHQIKPHKPKSLKTITEYELCKQECKRKRDQGSMGEYVHWLQEELRFAEEQLQTQAQQEQQTGGQTHGQ